MFEFDYEEKHTRLSFEDESYHFGFAFEKHQVRILIYSCGEFFPMNSPLEPNLRPPDAL